MKGPPDIGDLLSRKRFELSLRRHRPKAVSRLTAPKRAAVAALLRFTSGAPELLLMKRIDREGDRWSGHVSLPGGMSQPEDPGLMDTAIREAREEVGVDLRQGARLIGQLDDVRAIGKGQILPMAITPFVFCQSAPMEIKLGAEAESALWLPLAEVLSGLLDGTFDYQYGPVSIEMGCWRYQQYVVWGLTYRMVRALLRVVVPRPGSARAEDSVVISPSIYAVDEDSSVIVSPHLFDDESS